MGKRKTARRGGKRRKSGVSPPSSGELKNRIRSALRQVWTRYHEPRRIALLRAKRVRPSLKKDGTQAKRPSVTYLCAHCREEFPASQVEMDHVIAVGRTPQYPPLEKGDWEAWMERLFCDVDGLQCLCKPCHVSKSKEDRRQMRGA